MLTNSKFRYIIDIEKGKTSNGHAKSVMLRNNTSTLAQGRVIFLWLLLKAKELS